jgi:hypothetical protein
MQLQTSITLDEDEVDLLETWQRRFMSVTHNPSPEAAIHAILQYVIRLRQEQYVA